MKKLQTKQEIDTEELQKNKLILARNKRFVKSRRNAEDLLLAKEMGISIEDLKK